MAFQLYKDGTFEIDKKTGTINQLTGRFAFIFQIDQYNNYLLYKQSLIQNNLDSQKIFIRKKFIKNLNQNFIGSISFIIKIYEKNCSKIQNIKPIIYLKNFTV